MKRLFSVSLIIMMVVIFLGTVPANASIATISFEPSGNHDFGTLAIPYNLPAAYIVTVTSTPGGVLTASLSGDNIDGFTLSTEELEVPTIMTAIELTIIPKAGLVAGTYTATVTVDATDGTNGDIWGSESFDITFTVTSGFGEVPKTGVPGITGAIIAMFTFLAISIVSWGYILRRRLINGKNG